MILYNAKMGYLECKLLCQQWNKDTTSDYASGFLLFLVFISSRRVFADLYNMTFLLKPHFIDDKTSHCARHRINHPKNKPLSRKHLPSKTERAWEINLLVLITYDVLLFETFLIQRPQVNIWSILYERNSSPWRNLVFSLFQIYGFAAASILLVLTLLSLLQEVFTPVVQLGQKNLPEKVLP